MRGTLLGSGSGGGSSFVAPPPEFPTCWESDGVGVTDTFNRPDNSTAWGISDSGTAWNTYTGIGADGIASIQDNYGSLQADGDNGYNWTDFPLTPSSPSFTGSIRIKWEAVADNSNADTIYMVNSNWGSPGTRKWRLAVAYDWPAEVFRLYACYAYYGDLIQIASSPITINVHEWYRVRVEHVFGAYWRMKVWREILSEPEAWTLTLDTSSLPQTFGSLPIHGSPPYYYAYLDLYGNSDSPPSGNRSILYDDFDISWKPSSVTVLDDFNRSLIGKTGCTSHGGYLWVDDTSPGSTTPRVDGDWHVQLGDVVNYGTPHTDRASASLVIPVDPQTLTIDFSVQLLCPPISTGNGDLSWAIFSLSLFMYESYDFEFAVTKDAFATTVSSLGATGVADVTSSSDLWSGVVSVTITVTETNISVACSNGLSLPTIPRNAFTPDPELNPLTIVLDGNLRNDDYAGWDVIPHATDDLFHVRVGDLRLSDETGTCFTTGVVFCDGAAGPGTTYDLFDRSVAPTTSGNWGTGNLGTWTRNAPGGVTIGVQGDAGTVLTPGVDRGGCYLTTIPALPPYDIYFHWQHPGSGNTPYGYIQLYWLNTLVSAPWILAEAGPSRIYVEENDGGIVDSDTASYTGINGGLMVGHVYLSDSVIKLRVWPNGNAEPTTWDVQIPLNPTYASFLAPGAKLLIWLGNNGTTETRLEQLSLTTLV